MSWSVIRAAPGPEPAVGDADGGDVPAENRVPFACFFAGTDPVCTQDEPSDAGHAMVARGSRGQRRVGRGGGVRLQAVRQVRNHTKP